MNLFQLLQSLDPVVTPAESKIHLAGWNGVENPLDVYLDGKFDEWQSWQMKRNFERPFVVSLIAMAQPDRWLFAGVYDSVDCDKRADGYHYRLERRIDGSELGGRLIIAFKRPGRQSYLYGEKWSHALVVDELRSEPLRIKEFTGYSSALLTKQHLDIVVAQGIESWKAGLSAVAGVYVIADRHTGKLYVGKATGDEGIWGRWCAYSQTGHGGNTELKQLLEREGAEYAQHFQFGVLEIADTHASTKDVETRESYWKNLLQSKRPHGYNAN